MRMYYAPLPYSEAQTSSTMRSSWNKFSPCRLWGSNSRHTAFSHRRQFSQAATSNFLPRRTIPWLLGASLVTGITGFYIGSSPRMAADVPSFGTPNDFRSAIHELREALPGDDSVSTDADELERHGFSLYDYHPGNYCHMPSASGHVVLTKICRRIALCCRIPLDDGRCCEDCQYLS